MAPPIWSLDPRYQPRGSGFLLGAASLLNIGDEFKATGDINWVALSYTLCYLGFAVFVSRFSDIIGRRTAFTGAYIVFVAFSLACGVAQNMTQLIVCRAFQGIGGSGLYSLTMVILLETAPEKVKPALGGLIGAVIATAGVLGPVLGGILTHYASWRWVFWINGPFGAISLVLFHLAWPKAEYLPDIEKRTWSELDFMGSGLLIAAAVLVVFPFQNASQEALFKTAVFLAPLLTGIACWFALIVWELFLDRHWGDKLAAALPIRLLRNRMFAAAIANNMLLGFSFVMLLYAFPLHQQVVNDKNSLLAGIMLLPLLGASAVGSALSGYINRKKDRICECSILASSLVALGCGLETILSDSVEVDVKGLVFLVFVGLGFGLSAAVTTMAGNLHASIRDHAPAQGLLAQTRVLGGALGVAASSAVLGFTVRSQLTGVVDLNLLNNLENATSTMTDAQLAAVRHAYSDAFAKDMLIGAIVACAAFILAFGAWSNPKVRPTVQEHNERHLEEESERRRIAAGAEV
ncbi:major facilitator superfamily transporter [Pestalotiopsis sp. NC0098]|nr:major facilitator superfamily transporter [Pestalotiopsis sp. NC0098]